MMLAESQNASRKLQNEGTEKSESWQVPSPHQIQMITQVKDHTKNSHAINNHQGSKDNHEKQQKCDSVKNDKIEEIKKSIPSRLQKLTLTSMGTESVDQMRQRNTVVNKAGSQPKQGISRKIKISKKNNFVEKVKHPDERETKSKKRRFNREDAEENKAKLTYQDQGLDICESLKGQKMLNLEMGKLSKPPDPEIHPNIKEELKKGKD